MKRQEMWNHVFNGKILKKDANFMHNFDKKFFYKVHKIGKREFDFFFFISLDSDRVQ